VLSDRLFDQLHPFAGELDFHGAPVAWVRHPPDQALAFEVWSRRLVIVPLETIKDSVRAVGERPGAPARRIVKRMSPSRR
jgi:hypothetical protein